MMPEYKVTYSIEVDAADHYDAARTVARWLADEDSLGPIFKVTSIAYPTDTKTIDTDKLIPGDWYVRCEDGETIGPYENYSEACDFADDIHGSVKWIET
jgi:hypothetical protein